MNLIQHTFNSPLGPLLIVTSDKGLRELSVNKKSTAKATDDQSKAYKILKQTEQELTEYFAGQRKHFEVPLDTEGTQFQEKVWLQLTKIPYGKTCSYLDVARNIKNDKAVRAVGSANGKNPICIIVPCHRVIAADGSLGGYSGGLDIKRKLLALEQQN